MINPTCFVNIPQQFKKKEKKKYDALFINTLKKLLDVLGNVDCVPLTVHPEVFYDLVQSPNK